MTRINLVDPNFLSDQHLVAEYREIFMVGSALQRSLKSLNWQKTRESLPEKFTLNRGHVKFFYNKGKYLHKRYISISKEMRNRGMNLDPNRRFKREQWPDYLYNDWKPNRIDIDLIKDRINQKISQKPSWYRWTKYS
tara:strand:+ start:654 stop:1064 length:411 start_codon:yes stop_codon:yes gene_type:complete